MKIVWFVDNKFRELYGLHDLKKNLSKSLKKYRDLSTLDLYVI